MIPNRTIYSGGGGTGGVGGAGFGGLGSITSNKPMPPIYCRLCGEEVVYRDTTMCLGCYKKMEDDYIRKAIPKNSKVHCYKCFSHIKACKCPSSEKLREL